MSRALWLIIGAVVLVGFWGVTLYNNLIVARQGVDTAWAQVETNYQRRADLVQQLVGTVSGEANFEKSTLEAVINARSRATSITVDVNNAADLQKFQEAQGQLTGALSRLLAVSEQYPTLQTSKGFGDLRVAIEGSENRIAISRQDFNQVAGDYNARIMRFPSNMFARLFGFMPKAQFAAEVGTEKAPAIKFDIGTPAAPATK